MAAPGVTVRGRADAMAARLDDTAARLGVGREGRELIAAAHRAAMRPRDLRLDARHPDYLHGARTALILMEDAEVRDAPTLAAAIVTETRSALLRAPAETLVGLGAGIAELSAAVPVPAAAGEGLLEALLLTPAPVALIAVAERLDHARHLHLRDRAEWERDHALTCAVYAPFAARVHPRIGRRFEWWCGAFSRRFLRA